MKSIFLKEINHFFSSLIGYISLGVYLIISGLFLWVFPDTNILDYGFATLDTLFLMSPWFFMFLIPAITMRSFSDEYKAGTIELLATKPLTDFQIILGKFFAAVVLVAFAILPTLIYYYSVYQLGSTPGNIDTGATWGSYLGLLFLGASFISIGIFSSSLTDNQIVAFIIGVFLCFICYLGFEYISALPIFFGSVDDLVLTLGISAHYESISRGVVDTRDLLYFISLIVVFLLLSKTVLASRKW